MQMIRNCKILSRFLLVLSVLLLSLASPLRASSAELSGTVTDPSGAPIAGATITARNASTSDLRTTTTDPEGAYALTLPAGQI